MLAAVLSEAATLSRDVREAGAEREVEGLPSVPRGLPMNGEALADFSRWLGDSLSSPPAVSESPKEREAREHQAERKRKQAEAEEARQAKLAAEREEGRAVREAEDARERERERNPYRATWRDHLSDAAR